MLALFLVGFETVGNQVVLPTTTPESVQQRLAFYGADVMVHGSVWDEVQNGRTVGNVSMFHLLYMFLFVGLSFLLVFVSTRIPVCLYPIKL